MSTIDDKFNFLKWQFLARLPKGSIYERVKQAIIHRNLTSIDAFFYIYWLDIDEPLLKKFLLGTFCTTNDDYIPFIEWLNSKYRVGDFYEIPTFDSIIKIPVPFPQDYKCFKAEFLDIVMPYITGIGSLPQPFLEGPYEYHDVTLKNGDTVIDCGANFGLFSSVARSRECKVYAFEPTPRILNDYLRRLNDPRLYAINKAVSNTTGKAMFNTFANSSCNSLIGSSVSSISVDTVTIDDFVEEKKLTRVDFIKADIEGAERFMLEGARNTLKEFAPNLAICYYHCRDDLQVLTNLILQSNPNYKIETQWKKIYAKVPNKK